MHFCGGDRTEIARTDFTIYFSEFEYSTDSICKTAITSSLDKCLCSSTVSARRGLFFQFPLSKTYESYCLPFYGCDTNHS